MAARNMSKIEINIQEKLVRQFGYLQGSYRDARSTKHARSTKQMHGQQIINFLLLISPALEIPDVSFCIRIFF